MEPRDIAVFTKIMNYCDDIKAHLATVDNSRDGFYENVTCQHAVSFCLSQIGELVGKLSEETRSATRGKINWATIRGMRNIIVHDYSRVDLEQIWYSATEDLAELRGFCEKQLKNQDQ